MRVNERTIGRSEKYLEGLNSHSVCGGSTPLTNLCTRFELHMFFLFKNRKTFWNLQMQKEMVRS